ncbi:MAG: restriction endonuclease subunit S [Butyrivibrio sp.]
MEDIKRVQLSEIAGLITKGTTPTTLGYEFQEDGVNFLKIECFDENGGFIESKVAHISEECNEKLKRSQLKAGDVLFSIAGAIGRVAIVTEEMLPANTNQALAIIRIADEQVYLPYIKLILTSPIVIEQFEKKKQGVAQLNLSLKDINEISIPLPSKEKQIELAELFDKVAGVIAKRKTEISALDDLIKARFVEMFGEYYKNHINEKQLDEICDFIDYRGKTPEKSESGIPLITAKNVKDNRFSIEPQEFIPEENYDDVMTRGIPRVNDVLFTTEAPLGNVCRIPDVYERFCVGQRLITMQPHTDVINPEYLEHALTSAEFQEKMWQKSSGSTVKGIRSKLLVLLTIPVPPIELQNQFRDFLKQVDKSKVAVQKALDETQVLFDSLMQKYFG